MIAPRPGKARSYFLPPRPYFSAETMGASRDHRGMDLWARVARRAVPVLIQAMRAPGAGHDVAIAGAVSRDVHGNLADNGDAAANKAPGYCTARATGSAGKEDGSFSAAFLSCPPVPLVRPRPKDSPTPPAEAGDPL
ncbi:MAG: hypothetical protein LBP92_13100 [Deltaproteobacteria bacterium]|jgi:hypothetical protein|nr:hypothetical protein [Deltaproteobacteria bacterium]